MDAIVYSWQCGHDKCAQYEVCREEPYPDCSDSWQLPEYSYIPHQMTYPVLHGPKCKGHRLPLSFPGAVLHLDRPCMMIYQNYGLPVKEEYL